MDTSKHEIRPMMNIVAAKVAVIGGRFDHYHYHSAAFGSWLFEFSLRHGSYRCVFDGRDGDVRLERLSATEWETVNVQQPDSRGREFDTAIQILESL
jgi:hypothetical protein